MSIRGSFCVELWSDEITGSLAAVGRCHCSRCRKSHGAAFANVGDYHPRPVPMDVRRGIHPGVPILAWKREMLLQEVRLPACCYSFREGHGGGVGNNRR